MPETKPGSAGGKARALIQKQEAAEKINRYNSNPKLCLHCNKPIFAPKDKKLGETLKKKFCSRSCAAKHNNKGNQRNIFGINRTKSIIDEYSDEDVVNIFNESVSITDFGNRLGYKSKIGANNSSINARLEKLNLSIKDLDKTSKSQITLLTKGELFDRYEYWQTARSAIQKNARNVYSESNKPRECIVCGYDKHFEVAHIKAVSDFDNDVLVLEINNKDNLIALCPNHHWEYDNGYLDISKYISNAV